MILFIVLSIGSWLKGTGIALLVAAVFGILSKKGISQKIKYISGRGAVITREVGEMFLSKSNFLELLDKSIKDDGKLKENSVKELIAAGKEVIAETKDVILIIKPKK